MRSASAMKAVLRQFENSPKEIKQYFATFPDLIKRYYWEVTISYVFSRIEFAKHMTIYCGIVKLHRAEADLTWRAVEATRMSRSQFRELFETVFGQPIRRDLLKMLESAEGVRDRVVHGKLVREAEIRRAMLDILAFAAGFNDFIYSMAQFRPFGKLRGFKGRAKSLEKSTTRWILKGMRLPVS